MPLTEKQLSAVEKELKLNIPKEVRTLQLSCNGGYAVKTFFAAGDFEGEIGALLPVSPPKSFKGDSFEGTYKRMAKYGLSATLIPFGIDNGNAGIFCVDTKSGEVFYWVHDEPEDPLKTVAKSLSQFLSKLTDPPY